MVYRVVSIGVNRLSDLDIVGYWVLDIEYGIGYKRILSYSCYNE